MPVITFPASAEMKMACGSIVADGWLPCPGGMSSFVPASDGATFCTGCPAAGGAEDQPAEMSPLHACCPNVWLPSSTTLAVTLPRSLDSEHTWVSDAIGTSAGGCSVQSEFCLALLWIQLWQAEDTLRLGARNSTSVSCPAR